jgi:hypothetical protein
MREESLHSRTSTNPVVTRYRPPVHDPDRGFTAAAGGHLTADMADPLEIWRMLPALKDLPDAAAAAALRDFPAKCSPSEGAKNSKQDPNKCQADAQCLAAGKKTQSELMLAMMTARRCCTLLASSGGLVARPSSYGYKPERF